MKGRKRLKNNPTSLNEGEKNLVLFYDYNNFSDRVDWMEEGDKDEDFYFGKHYTDEDIATLNSRGQMALPLNRVRPLIRHAVSMYTAKIPTFGVQAKKSYGSNISWIFKEVIYDILTNNYYPKICEKVIFDMIRRGLGNIYVDYDPRAKDGIGEVVLERLTNREVMWDPKASKWGFRDAENVIVSKVISSWKAELLFPNHKDTIREVQDNIIGNVQSREELQATLNGDYISIGVDHSDTQSDSIAVPKVRIIMRHTKTPVKIYEVLHGNSRRIFYNEGDTRDYTQELQQSGDFRVSTRTAIRVKRYTSLVDRLVEEKILPISEYPVIPFIDEDTDNPFCLGDIRFLRPMQDVYNKAIGITLYHAQISSNPIVFYDPDMVDVDDSQELANNSAVPGDMIAIRKPRESVLIHQGSPLNQAFPVIADLLKNEMEYQVSTFGQDMGDPSGAHRTFRGTLAIHEWGIKNAQLTLRSINSSLTLLGKIVLSFIQAEYTVPETIKIATENFEDIPELQQQLEQGTITEDGFLKINEIMRDKQGIVIHLNNLNVGEYKIEVVPNSFLYTNTMAQVELYMELMNAKEPIVDAQAIREILDIKDKDKIQKRLDTIKNLVQANNVLANDLKNIRIEMSRQKTEIARADRAVDDARYEAKFEKLLASIKAQADIAINNKLQALSEAEEAAKQAIALTKIKQKE